MVDISVDQFAGIRSVALEKILEKKKEGLKVVGIYCTFCPRNWYWLPEPSR